MQTSSIVILDRDKVPVSPTSEFALIPVQQSIRERSVDRELVEQLKQQVDDLKAQHQLELKAVHYEAEKTILELQCRLTQKTQATAEREPSTSPERYPRRIAQLAAEVEIAQKAALQEQNSKLTFQRAYADEKMKNKNLE